MAEIRSNICRKPSATSLRCKNSSFTVANGAFFCLLGPSGCGKTTTLRMIAGLELPTAGRILLGGEDVTFRRAAAARHRLCVPALRALPAYECAQNIGFPLVARACRGGNPRRASSEAAAHPAHHHLLDQPVSRLSGGDRQRVALGRAIVREPMAS